jgi:hypothetical protein
MGVCDATVNVEIERRLVRSSGMLRLPDAWTVADALVPSDRTAFDDVATWTGSVVRGPDRRWYMYYTGLGSAEHGLVQRIGLVTSDDLYTWERRGDHPILAADPRWYETFGSRSRRSKSWMDGRCCSSLACARNSPPPAGRPVPAAVCGQ